MSGEARRASRDQQRTRKQPARLPQRESASSAVDAATIIRQRGQRRNPARLAMHLYQQVLASQRAGADAIRNRPADSLRQG